MKIFIKAIIIFSFILVSAIASAETPEAVHFKTKTITVGKQKLKAEIAENDKQHARGLMFRQELKDDAGMLFIFPDEQPRTFWMKNTFIPLAIGFFDANKTLIDIQEMTPVKSEMDNKPPTYASKGPAQYVLEVPTGWFQKKNVKVGETLSY